MDLFETIVFFACCFACAFAGFFIGYDAGKTAKESAFSCPCGTYKCCICYGDSECDDAVYENMTEDSYEI